MKIPFFDLKRQFAQIKEPIMIAVESVLDSQVFIMGNEILLLEKEIASYCNTKYAISCASGSDALLLALMALGIKTGDEVITTPYTFFATAGSIARLGAKPIFVDIDADTYNINPVLIEEKITHKTRAILPVHLFGQCADMEKINSLAKQYNLSVIEDAAQAIGASFNGNFAGSMGLIGCFSFYPTKNLGAAGDGGCLVTSDENFAQKLSCLRLHGETTKYYNSYVGINSRLDAIQAAILRTKLKYLNEWNSRRIANALEYEKLFSENSSLAEIVKRPTIKPSCNHIFHQYVIRVPNRDSLRTYLREHEIGTEVYYPLPLHLQECFSSLGYSKGDLPESELAADETLAIPIYPEMTSDMRLYLIECMSKFYKQN